ncbi:hypothetical protein GCM10007036_16460 [Alsobacter metallidurans]|uniref:DUF3299 domain-containing protein n=1 Tax=Alsobacter metallidurans TaxID=340221 RepID=A0A917I6U9_9HYPH|nr:hypothetical protein [Alsobacter metallidurans]GGH16074.1 hypothetical protein GCM10007036_16460 [Alsobacter metallidurans]
MRSHSEPRSNPPKLRLSRRRALLALAAGLASGGVRTAAAAPAVLDFADLYEASGVLGLKFSPKLLSLKGASVAMQGYMAPPLKAESDFFVLTREPVSLCPFCSSDADWPTDIVVIHLRRAAQPTRYSDPIAVTGVLEVGSATDAATGFVSQIRLMNADFRIV